MPPPTVFSRHVQDHIHEAQANLRRYEQMLRNPDDVPWGMVFLFYSALHLVQAYARHYTPDDIPRDHEDRNSYVAHYFEEDIARHYEALYHLSRQVRYGPVRFDIKRVREAHDDRYAKVRRRFRDEGIAWITPNSSNAVVQDRPST